MRQEQKTEMFFLRSTAIGTFVLRVINPIAKTICLVSFLSCKAFVLRGTTVFSPHSLGGIQVCFKCLSLILCKSDCLEMNK